MKNKVLITGMAALTLSLICGCAADVQTSGTETSTEALQGSESMQEQETESVSEEETETEELPVVSTVTITATGDCALGRLQLHGYEGSFDAYYDQYGEDYFFDDVREIFENDDFTLVNLECVLSESTDRVEKEFNMKGAPEYVGIMTGSSVEGCSLGNNHTFDYGESSHEDTENTLDEVGIIYGYNDHLGIYTTEDGITIGVVSVNMLPMSEQVEAYMENGIRELKSQGVNIVIACCHWGIEREHYPTDYQQNMGHKLVDWGADLVIGNHPHVLQGIEVYNGKVICYSLGNFCFGGNRNPQDKDTMIFQQTFTLVDGVLQENLDACIIPCRISSKDDRNDYQPTVLSGDRKQSLIDTVNTYCAPYGDITFDENGRMKVPEND